MDFQDLQQHTVAFALWHASLGCLAAALAAFALRRYSPAMRCWAWRLGLLKGPLALVLAVPVAIFAPAPPLEMEPLPSSFVTAPAPDPVNPWPFVYAIGVIGVIALRTIHARKVDRRMPRVEGVLRPRIVVPDDLQPGQADMALAHEAAHIRRHDPQWSLIADLICAALWFAPPVWICARAMRAEAEASCDAEALRETGAPKRAYAELLLAFAGPAPATALGGPARRLAQRINMLEKTPRYLPRFSAAALAALGAFVILPWRAEAQAAPPPAPQKPISTPQQEAQLKALRGQVAQMQNKIRTLEAQARALRVQAKRSEAGASVRLREAKAERLRALAMQDAVKRMRVDRQMSEDDRKAVQAEMSRVREEIARARKQSADDQARAQAEMKITQKRVMDQIVRSEMDRQRAMTAKERAVVERQIAIERGKQLRETAIERKRTAADRENERRAEAERAAAERAAKRDKAHQPEEAPRG